MVLDNASWHKIKSLQWHHFEPLFLPPYSPDLNPIERLTRNARPVGGLRLSICRSGGLRPAALRLWLRLEADYFTDWIARTADDLVEPLCNVLNHFVDPPIQYSLLLLIPEMSLANH